MPAFQRPKESSQANSPKKQGRGDEKCENIHKPPYPRSRNAFKDTVMEEADMAKAATKGVAKPATAIGTAIMF